MRDREKIVVTEIMVLMLLVWLGFLVHRSPRFPGSFWGTVLALAGAGLMLTPLLYSLVKRVRWINSRLRPYVSMRSLLTLHIYAGLTGPILALLHTGHKFDSPLGLSLTAVMLTVAVSGFVGRYLYQYALEDRAKKQGVLEGLSAAYREASVAFSVSGMPDAHGNAIALVESISDVEYALKTDDVFKRLFWFWLRFHIVIAGVFYALLAIHIWSGLHFGLQWFWRGVER